MPDFLHGAFGRNSLIRSLQALADFQVGVVDPDHLNIIIHFLFDDTRIADNTEGVVGILLVDMEEVQIIRELLRSLETLMDDFDLDDLESYTHSQQWETVLLKAQTALNLAKRKTPDIPG